MPGDYLSFARSFEKKEREKLAVRDVEKYEENPDVARFPKHDILLLHRAINSQLISAYRIFCNGSSINL